MFLLGSFMLYGFVRSLYYVVRTSRSKNLIWRISWGLLSFANLIGGLYFLGYKEQLLIVVNQYTEVYYAYIGLVIITFIYGGYKSNLMVEDAETRKKMNHDLYLFIIALIIAIILHIV